MRSVELKKITKLFRGEKVLDNLNLMIPSGKFFVLLGPSGCGKTTILRIIGGFENADSGEIYLGDKRITVLPPNKRNVNTVFQTYALFPHMNVFENVAYSLTVRGKKKDEITRCVGKLLRAFGLTKQIYKSVEELSGGQQQRVALARAIINEPDVLLLDEPLAALDFKLREKLLLELIDLQDQLKTTFIYVTHDPFEALTVADQMAIMSEDGLIEQLGTPEEIYEFPVSSFVAKFVGSTNILRGTFSTTESGPVVLVEKLGSFPVDISRQRGIGPRWLNEGKKIFISIRPEKVIITKKALTGFSTKLSGIVKSIVYYGRSTQYHVRVNDDYGLRVFEQNKEHIAKEIIDYDEQVNLYWQKENVILLSR